MTVGFAEATGRMAAKTPVRASRLPRLTAGIKSELRIVGESNPRTQALWWISSLHPATCSMENTLLPVHGKRSG
jgi:hypothetical protein